jgi:hypothetical protein
MKWAGALCVLVGVLAATAPVRAEPEETCMPRAASDLDSWREMARQSDARTLANLRAREAERIGDSSDVLRLEDRLFLALSGDQLTRLTDCRYGDELKIHLYEAYDKPGGFYVVATHEYEDFSYTLVMKSGGKTFSTLSRPLWSPDAKRFVHGRCDQLNGYDTLQIVSPLADDLQVESTTEMPCELRTCAFAWESATSLSTVCRAEGQAAAAETTFKLVLKDGAWVVVR